MTNSHETEIYVRFCETDAVGHVNNTSHFLYFEEARSKFFKMIYPQRKSSASFILASIKCDYLEQAYAGEKLKVYTDVIEVGNKSFTLKHRLVSKNTKKTLAKAEAITVCFNFTTQSTIPLPTELRSKLEGNLVQL